MTKRTKICPLLSLPCSLPTSFRDQKLQLALAINVLTASQKTTSWGIITSIDSFVILGYYEDVYY
ncbi:unnamed protein product [Larinioides sclopetarius]|uniref:Uncharacterized protein n=1 Tax=Larinioides sclopetarius TaxID=280406 RepID=A0AAV2ANT1_9ARAC